MRVGPLSISHLALIAWTGLALFASFLILRPFLAPIAWGVALALLVYPQHALLTQAVRYRSVAAGIVTCTVGITIIIPSVWVAQSLVSAAAAGIEAIVPSSLHETWRRIATESPAVAEALVALQRVLQLSDVVARASDWMTSRAEYLIGSSIRAVVHGMLTLFVVYFLLRDGPCFLAELRRLIPLQQEDTELLITRIHDTIHAALFGVVAVAILQGLLGAMLLYWLKLPGIVVWSTIMGLLALVPYLGTFIVWIPLALFLAIEGDWHRAGVTVVWGTIVIGLADNLVYPYLVGKRLHYHTLMVFFFLLGGVVIFGSAGVVLGPVVLATTERLLWLWQRGERLPHTSSQ